jgi:hypothetical protein
MPKPLAFNAASVRRSAHEVYLIQSARDGLPKDSWWLRCRTREEFDARIKAEAGRMKLSKFGRVGDPTF